ncbi:hypothetical protein NDU88_004088 [Pleurodeles waltl]|uniref:Uncharacterized protein n=1 Tax=Pleurodeles waltl TaxID=8319 RepID=A0AAV7VHM9_PLEWA|nr:hypothetical protein NDU88_004088 [Pleurodeles waltl]
MGCASRRLRLCQADPLRPRETRLHPPARPLLPRRAAVSPAIFLRASPSGIGSQCIQEASGGSVNSFTAATERLPPPRARRGAELPG